MVTTVPDILIYLINNLFRIYIISILLRTFLNVEGERKKVALRTICYMAFYAFNSMGFLCFNVSSYVNLIINVLGVALVTWTYKGSCKAKVSIALIILGISLIAENLVYRVMLLMDTEKIVTISLSVVNLLMFMLSLLIEKYMEARKGEAVEIFQWATVIVIPAASILLLGVLTEGCDDDLLILMGDICLILFNIFVFYLFDRIIRMNKVQCEREVLAQQNIAYQNQLRMMSQHDENLSILRHDMKNHLLVLQKMVEAGEKTELKVYLEKLLPSLESTGRFSATGNTAIDSLINYKLSEITRKDTTEVKTDISVSRQPDAEVTDICIILGNLLDNAIRALSTCGVEKRLSLKIKEERSTLYIKIENTHTDELIPEKGLLRTTKRDAGGHGWGLRSVRRIVEKHDGEMHISHTEDLFSVEIMLYIC